MSATLAGSARPSLGFLFSIALPLYALDQATKWWVFKNIPYGQDPRPSEWFQLCHWTNTGSAWGMFKDGNTAFIVLSFAALIGLVVFYLRGAFPDALSRWGVALLVGGILGNLTDRLVHGHVIDFLLFNFGVWAFDPFPAFNVADSCICIAAGLFILGSFSGEPKRSSG